MFEVSISVRLEQPLKVLELIAVTPLGILIVVRLEHPLNELWLIAVRVLGKITVVKPVALEANALGK
jgi:hypothetical protein